MKQRQEKRGLAYQIIVFIFISLFLIFTAFIAITRILFSHIMMENAQETVSHLANETTYQIENRLTSVVNISRTILTLYRYDHFERNKLDSILHDWVYEFENLEAITIAYAPSYHQEGYSRTIFHSHNRAVYQELHPADYQYLDWFQIPFELKSKYWTEPWYDATATQETVISYCLPLFAEGKCVGIMRLDTKLSALQKIVSPLKLKHSGYAFLVSSIGTIITHPADSLIFNESIFSLAEATNDKNLRQIGKKMINGNIDFVRLQDNAFFGDSWLYYCPLLTNNWSLGIIIPHKDVVGYLNLLLIIQTLFSIIIFLTISFIVYYRTLSVSRPIRLFTEVAERIGQGDFDAKLPKTGNSYEIDRLILAFEKMQESLKDYIKNLEITNAEKNRIETEVKIASEIQRKLIPENTLQPYEIKELRCYGILEPAGDIGGDLYDFFPIDKSHFLFVIADVAGKGIVASMTMTIVSTYLRTVSTYHYTASEIMQNLNNFLCKQTSASNFVTALLGIINLKTGELEFSNAGHTPMIIRKSDLSYKIFAETHSYPLGIFANKEIHSTTIKLEKGEEIILVTDGVTETMNATEDFLGLKGLENIIKNLSSTNPEQTVRQIFQQVHSFAQNTPQKDDITILVIDYKKNED